jgi:CRISPR-associated protein Cmr5
MHVVSQDNLLRDQQRALHAYESVGKVPPEGREAYKILVNDFAAAILRSGLSAALAGLQRKKSAATPLLEHIASAGIRVPGLAGANARDFAQLARKLDAEEYMLATRELLKVATWLKRAAQATFGGEQP